jgi:aspartyl-tRNA(Asn)/glutamyl-tRNA(Gln) amidotransferase subunit B
VDYNCAGVPLMELVTEPVIHSAKDTTAFARELQLLLRTLGVSEANLEKGEMRVEPNISVSDTEGKFGTKVEVKNLNSFRSVERAIEHELARMIALYEAGREDEIVQETRGWDENKQSTFSQRSKENAHDYRYFPDPDLPKMKLHSAFPIADMQNALPELPWEKRLRYAADYGLKEDDVELYVGDLALANYFEAAVEGKDQAFAQTASNYLISDVLGLMKKDTEAVLPAKEAFVELITMVTAGEITSRGAKDILAVMVKNREVQPIEYAKQEGLLQQNNEEELKPIIQEVINSNAAMVEQYKGGKEAVLQALVGMVMKATKGSANPAVATKLLKEMM